MRIKLVGGTKDGETMQAEPIELRAVIVGDEVYIGDTTIEGYFVKYYGVAHFNYLGSLSEVPYEAV